MDLATFHALLDRKKPLGRGHPLNDKQRNAVNHGDGPLWLLAGPGSGKTEVLVTRILKLLCVDRVAPRSILVTTFTEKAAKNIEDRLAEYLMILQEEDPSLKQVDLADVRIGTLHSLCNDILQEYRYSEYQNVRLMDEVEQNLFLYREAGIADCDDHAFWAHFFYAVPKWSPSSPYPPGKWKRVRAAVTLFNRIVEDCVDVSEMKKAGGHWKRLAEYYEQYRDVLRKSYRCDFAHVQALFLQFLRSHEGQQFLSGNGTDLPPLQHIFVDEYQDTNPIQERIYLELASQQPHNLTVVGDDDQALYRFRGATVSCMVNFDKACKHAWNVEPSKLQLDRNYRSHEKIVSFINDYIKSFPEMNEPGVRAPSKEPIRPASTVKGEYPAVSWIQGCNNQDVANKVASLIKDHLLHDGIITDLSQCVVLMRSTRDTDDGAGPLLKALAQRGIPVYNPRSKSFLESTEVKAVLGVLVKLIDPHKRFQTNKQAGVATTVQSWLECLDAILKDPHLDTTGLREYINRSAVNIPKMCAKVPDDYLNLNLMEILYRVIALEPFVTWRRDPTRNLRLSKVTRLFESYHNLNLDRLKADASGSELSPHFIDRFYYHMVGYLVEARLDDDEDEEVIVPRGYLPIMTIHQSKGLEFPFVIVMSLGKSSRVGAAQILENELAPYRQDIYPRPTRKPELLALEDDIRLLYVAYSRAQYGLILAGTNQQFKNHVAVPGRDFTSFKRQYPKI